MFYLLVEQASYSLSNLLQLEALLQLILHSFTKILFGAFLDVEGVDFFEESEANLIDAADYTHSHALNGGWAT